MLLTNFKILGIILKLRGTMENLELAREFFKGDRFQQRAGVEIEEVSNSHSVCVIRLTPDHFNADGGVQGGRGRGSRRGF